MPKKMLIDATHAEETRVVVVDGNKVEEFDFESENKRQLAGNIYLAKVTRVEPSLQAAFVDYGGNRHGFLAFSEIHPDYYQIPVADREALMEEERAYAESLKARDEEEDTKPKRKSRSRSRSRSKAAAAKNDDAIATAEVDVDSTQIEGMETIDLTDDQSPDVVDTPEASSPMETVAETPVDTPAAGEEDAVQPEAATDDDAVVAQDAVKADDGTDDTAKSGDDAENAAKADDDVESTAKADDAPSDSADAETAPSEATTEDTASDEANHDDDDDEDTAKTSDATKKDETIESVADEDDSEDIRPVRKPRPRRYKIQEVIKVRQILLVQVVKEERGNKGAALTTYLSLAGRYCVLMPNTARGGGISRKITNAADRKKLKEIANEIEVPQGAGLIVRTAGAQRTKAEIKRDYEYLQRMWEQIRELTLKSIAPSKIYEEGDLIKRSIRDLYNRDIDEVFVEGERGYRTAKDFMKMIMPSHAKNVKHYQEGLPLFARFQVETYLSGMFNPTVQLKSGGYIVIGITEALVAIDVNSGRSTKEGSIEDTALKTNLEAAEEVARQLRLRDLAGLIVIDFIDMDERKNNAAVEKRMKDKLKTDRARIQVGRISGFGLMEMSRQRLRPGMIEATTQPCPTCHGTGLIRSDDNMALNILRQIEEEGTRRRSREVLVRCPVAIANYLMNMKREHIAHIEARYGLSVRIEGDPSLVSPDFALEKFKTATRKVVAVEAAVVSVDASIMDDVDEAEDAQEDEAPSAETPTTSEEETKPKRRRRRRRRRKSSTEEGGSEGSTESAAEGQQAEGDAKSEESTGDAPAPAETTSTEAAPAETPVEGDAAPAASEADTATEVVSEASGETVAVSEEAPAPKKKTTRSRSRKKVVPAETDATAEGDAPAVAEAAPAEDAAAAPEPEAKPKRKRAPRRKKADILADEAAAAAAAAEATTPETASADAATTPDATVEEAPAKPVRKTRSRAKKVVAPEAVADAPAPEVVAEPAPEPTPEVVQDSTPDVVAEPTPDVVVAEPTPETVAAAPEPTPEPALEPAAAEPAPAPEPDAPPKPKRRGWWSLGSK
ncbi:MAG: Rne/Rng family ribonuclease [Aliishimia sp.]